MSIEQIKQELDVLSDSGQSEVSAYLFHLRHRSDLAYHEVVDARTSDRDPSHWLTPDEFERQLAARSTAP